MNRLKLTFFFILMVLMTLGNYILRAQVTVDISPSKDNTLYQDNGGAISHGDGEFLFAGNTSASKTRKALISFNTAGERSGGLSAYPNPFSEQTTLSYRLSGKAQVNLKICNILGQEILTLVNELQDQGEKTVVLNLSGQEDASGRPGVYYAILTAGYERQVIKLFQAR